MARTLYCRWDVCGKPIEVEPGKVPALCPACGLRGMWATEPGHPVKERRKRPRVPWDVTDRDYKLFLRRAKIAKD